MADSKKSSREVMAELTAEERRREFHEKDIILRGNYEQIPAAEFYADYLFHDMNEEEFRPSIIMYEYGAGDGDHQWKREAVYIDELVDYCWRNDVAVNPCGYWNNYPKKKLMRRVYAFAMDVDGVRPNVLKRLIGLINHEQFPRPTTITNSGSGIHFFYILDTALHVGYRERYLQNLQLAEQIYFMLHAKLKELYKGAQRHHLGQDYRVVGSLTKYNDITTAWKCGGFWSIEALAAALEVDISEIYRPLTKASPRMVTYAKNIAQDLGLAPPDMTDPGEVYEFIAENKDAAYQIRQARRARSGGGKRTVGWYRDTWNRVYTRTEAGNRFNALRGLAIVAYKCGISEEQFEADLEELCVLWDEEDWHGDPFNVKNAEAIMRMFRNGERYKNTSRARLEELFGWQWRGSKRRSNPLPQSEHLELARLRKVQKKRAGTLKNPEGRPKGSGTAQMTVALWRAENPGGRKADCIRETGLSKPTVYKWWDSAAIRHATAKDLAKYRKNEV